MTTVNSRPLFIGDQVIIRHLFPTDTPLYYQWLQDPIFLAYKPYLKRLCPTPAHLFTYLTWQAQIKPRTEIETLVIHKQSQEPIGIIGLASIDRFNQKAEFSAGFVRGHGTAMIWEALHAGVTLSFAHFNLHKLYCYITPNNSKVMRIMQRYHFNSEGYFKEELLVEQQRRVDLCRFALLRTEWEEHLLRQRLNRLVPITI